MWIGGTKKAVHWPALKLAGCGRPFRCFECWRVQAMRIPKNSQIRRICISGALFLFYALWFFECEKIVLNCFNFWFYMQKSRTKVRVFCLHLFCQCKLVRPKGLEPPAFRTGIWRSIQLRYGRTKRTTHQVLFYYNNLCAVCKEDFLLFYWFPATLAFLKISLDEIKKAGIITLATH